MEFYHIFVGNEMVGAHLLAVKDVAAPHARELEAVGDVFVHEARDVVHGITAAHGKGLVVIGLFAWCLGVDAHNFERLEQERPELLEAVAGLGRDREGGEAQPEQFLEDLDLLGVRVEVTLVGDQHGRKIEPERVVLVAGNLR